MAVGECKMEKYNYLLTRTRCGMAASPLSCRNATLNPSSVYSVSCILSFALRKTKQMLTA
jgi:hypothetical protein